MNNPKNTIDWSEFIQMGNPENAPVMPDDETQSPDLAKMQVRVHIERKHRGGKEVSIVKGITLVSDALESIAKELKTKCGVGGVVKDGDIIIQGNNRDKIIHILLEKGFKNIKKAGG